MFGVLISWKNSAPFYMKKIQEGRCNGKTNVFAKLVHGELNIN